MRISCVMALSIAFIAFIGGQTVGAQNTLMVFEPGDFGPYVNSPVIAPDGSFVRFANGPSYCLPCYQIGVAAAPLLPYNQGELLQWAVLARLPAGQTGAVTLNVGVQNGNGDEDPALSPRGQLNVTSTTFQWVVATAGIATAGPKTRAFFYIPGVQNGPVTRLEVSDMVFGTPAAVAAYIAGDRDSDGFPDAIDNCPTIANADQTDSDHDGIGDACDSAQTCTGIAPPPGMISWWAADGDADDRQDGNDGTLKNGATYAAGKVDQAFLFDGVNDYVQVGNRANLVMSRHVSVDAWINPSGAGSGAGGAGGIIVNKEGEYEISRFSDGTIRWAFAMNNSPGWAWVNTGFVAPLNMWTHITVVYDNGRITTYGNGSPVHVFNPSTTPAPLGDVHTGANDFRIGGRQLPNDSVQNFNGSIDEVEVFNRALTRQEAAALFAAGSAGKCKDGDGDGIADATDNCPFVINPEQIDTDGDGQGDTCDADDDGDGISDGTDNCSLVINADQTDTDADGFGNACDADDDNDGVLDGNDAFPLDPTESVDTDGDGIGNNADLDDDGDGFSDTTETNAGSDPLNAASTPEVCDGLDNDLNEGVDEGFLNTDGDSMANCVDPDDDNDGVLDVSDNCPLVANPDQADFDLDGRGDVCDPQTGPPSNKDQCKNGGWMRFDFPRTFVNQGDCIQFVNNGH